LFTNGLQTLVLVDRGTYTYNNIMQETPLTSVVYNKGYLARANPECIICSGQHVYYHCKGKRC